MPEKKPGDEMIRKIGKEFDHHPIVNPKKLENPKGFGGLVVTVKTLSDLEIIIDQYKKSGFMIDPSPMCSEWVSVADLEKLQKQFMKPIKNIPCVNIDFFWEKFKKSQIAHWSKNEPFSAFITGYIVAMKEVFGEAFSQGQKGSLLGGCQEPSSDEPAPRKFVDIKDMPNYNAVVKDHVESMSKGELEILNGTPHCKKHGAMNKVGKEGIWRCLMCGVGCYEIREVSSRKEAV